MTPGKTGRRGISRRSIGAYGSTGSKQLTVLGKCLDASGKGTTNGTAVIIWAGNGQTNRQWTTG